MHLSTELAIAALRADPGKADLIRDAYLDEDVHAAAARFSGSAEFNAVLRLLHGRVPGADVLDLGAGSGIASYSFVQAGARFVSAIEPDDSDLVGRGAAARLLAGMPVEILEGNGEWLPVADESIDIVYVRQVLHHVQDVPQVMREAARVLRSGGALLACREHVADDDEQLARFLAAHPVHQLAGGEHAFPLAVYVESIRGAGLELARVLRPWDSIINAYPAARSEEDIAVVSQRLLRERLGVVGLVLGNLAPIRAAVKWKLHRSRTPGRMYSFLAFKD